MDGKGCLLLAVVAVLLLVGSVTVPIEVALWALAISQIVMWPTLVIALIVVGIREMKRY